MKLANSEAPKKRGGRAGRDNGSATAATPAERENGAADRRALLDALEAVADGDFSVRLPGDWTGLDGKIADRFNDIVAANQKMAEELARVGQVVGREGKTRQRMRFDRVRTARGARCRSRSTR